MNTDDPHLKCHLKSQIILHICPHHHVVVLKLRCRRSCHNANKICTMIGTSVETIRVQSSPPEESPVVSPRVEDTSDFVRVSSAASSLPAQTARYRRHVNVTPTVPQETLVFSQKPSVVAWFQRCFRVSHLFGLPTPRKVDSSNMTHIPATSGVASNGSSVVGKIATTRMMCW